MHLPYANLITRILQVYGFDLSNEQAIMLGWNHYFGKKSMTKLNIFQVNGIWQLGRPHHAHEEDDEEDELSAQDVEGGQPQPTILSRTEMLTQIWTGMQDMRESMRNVNIRFDRFDERMERNDQRMDRLEDTLNQIHCQQGHWLSICICYCLLFYLYFSGWTLLLLFLLFFTLNIEKFIFNIKLHFILNASSLRFEFYYD